MQIRKTDPTEFRAEAVKMALEQGPSVEEAAKRLGIPISQLAQGGKGRHQ